MYYANLAEAFQIPEVENLIQEEETKEEQIVEPVQDVVVEKQFITNSFPCKCKSNFDMNHFIIILLLIIIFFKK